MKVIILSDIHGSIYYLEQVLEVIEKEKIEKIILLGDYFNYLGRENSEYIKLLNKLKNNVIAISGNSDREDLSKLLEFKLYPYYLLEIDQHTLFLTHGHKDYSEFIDDNMILVSGHSHQYVLKQDYINPGSTTYPRKNKEHTYIIYENSKFCLYDIDKRKKIKELVIERK